MLDRQQMSDQDLLRACREGDLKQFSPLWGRHRHAGIVAARHLAPSLDAEDLVSEAYLRIFELVSKGRGPEGAFRPYLYQTIKTTAADRLRAPENTSAELDQLPDPREVGLWEDRAFDLNATARAFASLPERWQSALWYTEVEGLPPRQVAPKLDISANAVSALVLRAREGLQSAWVEAHLSMRTTEQQCRSTLRRLQRYQRDKLTARASREVEAHLSHCSNCSAAAIELSALNQRLALTLSAVVFGTAASPWLTQLGILGVGATRAAGTGASAAMATTTAAASSAATILVAASTLVVAAAIGGGVLVASTFSENTPPTTENKTSPAVESTAPPHDEREMPTEQSGTKDVATATEQTSEANTSSAEPSNERQPNEPVEPPVPPTPAPPPPIIPVSPPATGSFPGLTVDANLQLIGVCYFDQAEPGSIYLSGELSEYGVIFGQWRNASQQTYPITNPNLDGVQDPTDPSTSWSEILTGSDVSPDPSTGGHFWFTEHSLDLFLGTVTNYNAGLTGTLELRIQTTDDRTSDWIPVPQLIECS